ncbi:MAG: YceI family protein [Candidatus Velthaea sp.]|jgi:polyisoprenoid-binding protein YceI
MLRTLTAASAAAVLLLAAPAGAADQLWKIDPAHSDVEFGIKHFGLSSVKGTIPIQAGQITLAAGKEIPAGVDVTLNAAGIDTQNEMRNGDLKSANWFDTAKYPAITFTSTKIIGTDPANFTIDGNLTMHGVTKPIELQVHFEGKGQGGRGEQRVAYSATTTIHRRDFALVDSHTNALGALVVGDDAAISLQVEGVAAP